MMAPSTSRAIEGSLGSLGRPLARVCHYTARSTSSRPCRQSEYRESPAIEVQERVFPGMYVFPKDKTRGVRCRGFTGSQGGAVLDRPDFLTGDRPSELETDTGDGASQKDQGRGPGGGSWRVMLLDSPNHTEETVVAAITTVVGLDKNHAINCFATSKQLGQAFVASALLEIAEFWQQELYRRQCRVTLEPDTSVL